MVFRVVSTSLSPQEHFRATLEKILTESFPDATIESLTAAHDLKHAFFLGSKGLPIVIGQYMGIGSIGSLPEPSQT